MTIEFRPPRPGEEGELRALFTEAFGDEAFTNLFFDRGYSPERCLVATGDSILAALHWFDCSLDSQKAAYVYGIAAFASCRGRGIGSKLIRFSVEYLQNRGYEVITLVPAEESLFPYYERFGFRRIGTISEKRVTAAAPLPVRTLTASEYAEARRKLLPAHSLQQTACLPLLAGYADFYATPRAIAAVSGQMVWELLGEEADAPGLIAALALESATVRTPGRDRPFAMAIGAEAPIYLGLALD